MLCFFKIVRIGNFRPETNPKQAKISCLRVVLSVSIKNLHLLTKLRHFRVSFEQVFLSTYNVPIPHPILAVFRLRLSKFFRQRTMRQTPQPVWTVFRLETRKFFRQRTMHRLNCTTNHVHPRKRGRIPATTKLGPLFAVLTIFITLLSLHSRSCSAHDSFYFFLASHGCISRSCHSECSVSRTIVYSYFCIACCHKTIDKA